MKQGRKMVDGGWKPPLRRFWSPLLAINCLINPEAVLIGGRLPPASSMIWPRALNQRLQFYASTTPAIAPSSGATMSDDAPAVGAAISAVQSPAATSRARS